MSLNNKSNLTEVAKILCRELRKNSTPAERLLWEKLRNRNFLGKKFYRQHPVFHDVTGRETFFIADFYCFSDRLIIEIDGEYHKFRLQDDAERTDILNHLGLNVLRFSNEEVINNLDEVLSKIKNALMLNSRCDEKKTVK